MTGLSRGRSGRWPLAGATAIFLSCQALGGGYATARDVVMLPVPYMAQPDDQTCLPTSLLMAIHYLGREPDFTSATVQRLQKRTQYDRYNVPAIVTEYGLHAFPSWLEHGWTRATVEAELRRGRPVVLGVNLGRAGHFVLAVGYTDDGRVIVHDPWKAGPDYPLGGPFRTSTWEAMLWRNGIMLRGEPFPEPASGISGDMVLTTAPRRLAYGEAGRVEVAVKNNGTEPWPAGTVLAAVDAYSSVTAIRKSAFAAPGWISGGMVAAPDRPVVAPGETALFRFEVRAPELPAPAVFRENFNLLDPKAGRWFSEDWQRGPGNRQIAWRVGVGPRRAWNYPLVESGPAAGGGPSLPWEVAGGWLESSIADASTSAAPSGAPVWRLRAGAPASPGTRRAAAWVGDPAAADSRVEAWVWCGYRPETAARGFERIGLFLRDNGLHAADGKDETAVGECLAMSYDSDDGRVRAGSVFNGGIHDFAPTTAALFLKRSGWHRFAIAARGDTYRYELDGRLLHEQRNTDAELAAALRDGDCGVFHSVKFDDPTLGTGIHFSGFRADK